MKLSKHGIFIFLLIITLMVGCSDTSYTHSHQIKIGTEEFEWLPMTENDNEVLLFNRFEQRLFAYNVERHYVVNRNESFNYFQFEFNDLTSNLYTTGHSTDNQYKMFAIVDNKIDVLATMPKNTGLFPLAYDSATPFFIKTYYNNIGIGEENYEMREIVLFDIENQTFRSFENTKGQMISKGVYENNNLYYSVYNQIDDDYDIFILNIAESTNIPTLLYENVISSDIYMNNGELLISDTSEIYSEFTNFPKASLNYFYDELLLQIEIQETGTLGLAMTNTITKEKTTLSTEIQDFIVSDNTITIYENNEIKILKLK